MYGSIIPMHAGSKKHYMNTVEVFYFLQKPGFGPTLDPPKHTALSVGQLKQSPVLFIYLT